VAWLQRLDLNRWIEQVNTCESLHHSSSTQVAEKMLQLLALSTRCRSGLLVKQYTRLTPQLSSSLPSAPSTAVSVVQSTCKRTMARFLFLITAIYFRLMRFPQSRDIAVLPKSLSNASRARFRYLAEALSHSRCLAIATILHGLLQIATASVATWPGRRPLF
jgi:hypothetical protein